MANTPSGEVRRGLSAFTSHNFHGDKTMPRGNQYKLNNDTSFVRRFLMALTKMSRTLLRALHHHFNISGLCGSDDPFLR